MNLIWAVFAILALVGVYALHRLALRLEENGYIYYWNKKPTGSAAGSLVAMQRVIEPQIVHLTIATERKHDEQKAHPGADQEPPARSS